MKSRSGFRQHICFLSQSPSERVGLSPSLLGRPPTTHSGGHNLRNSPPHEKFPWSQGDRMEVRVKKGENWISKCPLPPIEVLQGYFLLAENYIEVFSPLPSTTTTRGKKKLINPAVSRFLKSLSQKDICLHTDKLANLMLLPLGCSWLSFWLCQWQNLSPFKCSTRHFARPMQWPRYKRTSDFFCKEKCLRIQNVTHLKHCVINKAHINIKFPQVASVSLFFSSSSAEYEI